MIFSIFLIERNPLFWILLQLKKKKQNIWNIYNFIPRDTKLYVLISKLTHHFYFNMKASHALA